MIPALRVLFSLFALASSSMAWAFPADAEVREILRARVEDSRRGVGYVVALVDESGSRIVAFGHARRGSDERVTGDSVFELGSVTKVFTSLLLAVMVERDEVGLHDPIATLLPSIGSPRMRRATLLQLSQHTAGLPPWPDNMRPVDPSNPRDVYPNEALFAFVRGYEPRSEPGTRQLYSNCGMALLGELLARRARLDFEALLKARVLEPLDMHATAIRLTPALRATHALGHTVEGRPIPLGDVRGMPGAGSLRSTGRDMARFVEANLGLRDSPLRAALVATHETHADSRMPDLETGLGWFYTALYGARIVEHSGATEGFRAHVALDLAGRRGVVVLSNSDEEIRNIGIHLLVPSVPLFQPDPPEK